MPRGLTSIFQNFVAVRLFFPISELAVMPQRPTDLLQATFRQLLDDPPRLAVLPWGATEAHGYHLPYGTDVFEATAIAQVAGQQAAAAGAKLVVLPTIPFGNDEQQLDQLATISFTTATAMAVLRDIARSLTRQGIQRLVILNGHGGNEFKPLVRDLQSEFSAADLLIIVINFYQLIPDVVAQIFEMPGDHAGELETSLLLHLHPELVELDKAGSGDRIPFQMRSLQQPGVWTPRPWSRCHPDTGSGDPRKATAAKGKQYFEQLTAQVSEILCEVADLRKPLV